MEKVHCGRTQAGCQSKQVSGLDSGQVTTWTSWHR
jgi:hypothetical protein